MNMPAADGHKYRTGRAGGAEDYTCSVAGELSAVRRCISAQLTAGDSAVDEMLTYVGARTGKMLRPAMLLLAGASCGEIGDSHVRAAAMVELIHAATLLHDDVLDEADSRRSVRTANRLWGNASAVLLGDYVLSKVFVMSTHLEPRQAGELLSRTAVEICRGELRQNVERGNWRLGEEAYYAIVREKTASLFSTASRLGSLISGGCERRHEQFAEYGLKVGMAFQITDDLLDIVGEESRVGKTLGTDLMSKKLTLPLIHMLGRLDEVEREVVISRLAGAQADGRMLAEMLHESGSIEYTRSVAERFCQEAVEIVESIETVNSRAALAGIAANICGRSA